MAKTAQKRKRTSKKVRTDLARSDGSDGVLLWLCERALAVLDGCLNDGIWEHEPDGSPEPGAGPTRYDGLLKKLAPSEREAVLHPPRECREAAKIIHKMTQLKPKYEFSIVGYTRWQPILEDAIEWLKKPAGDPRHSPDFRSVRWGGTLHSFTAIQAVVVKVLWNAFFAGTPEVSQTYLMEQTGTASDMPRLRDVFRSADGCHAAWGTMIVKGETKGSYRLQLPAEKK